MKLDAAFRQDLANSVLCWLATVNESGSPNVSPKEIFAVYDDQTLVIADIMSPNSVRNIQANSKVCVSFIDVFRQRGYKVEGVASVVAKGTPDFDVLGRDLLTMAGPAFPIRRVIRVDVERVTRIVAPSYVLFPERSERERMQGAYTTYGVQPTSKDT